MLNDVEATTDQQLAAMEGENERDRRELEEIWEDIKEEVKLLEQVVTLHITKKVTVLSCTRTL